MCVSNFGSRDHGLFARDRSPRVVLVDQPLLVREDYAGNKKDKTKGKSHFYSLLQAALLSYSRPFVPYETQSFMLKA